MAFIPQTPFGAFLDCIRLYVRSSHSARQTPIGCQDGGISDGCVRSVQWVHARKQSNAAALMCVCVCSSFGRSGEIKAGCAVLSASHEEHVSAIHVQPFFF